MGRQLKEYQGVVALDRQEVNVSTTKEENEKKKAYMWKYRDSVRRVTRIESELAEIRAMKLGTGINYDGMPSGFGESDLSDYFADLDKMERKLRAERYKRIMIYVDISRRIEKLKSQTERDVLFYRYIKGFDWWEVAENMRYSERQVHRFHAKALKHFQLPEDK